MAGTLTWEQQYGRFVTNPDGTPWDGTTPLTYGQRNMAEVRAKRSAISNAFGRSDGGQGFDPLAPDAADLALRDILTGGITRRKGSGRSAVAMAFNPTAPLGSIMGNY
jgi:hypothetical protein